MNGIKQTIKNKQYEIYFFSNPMYHEDWHIAEKEGLKYFGYQHEHDTDYWDDRYLFCKIEDYEIFSEWWRNVL